MNHHFCITLCIECILLVLQYNYIHMRNPICDPHTNACTDYFSTVHLIELPLLTLWNYSFDDVYEKIPCGVDTLWCILMWISDLGRITTQRCSAFPAPESPFKKSHFHIFTNID